MKDPLARALQSLDGLSIGDALGEMLSTAAYLGADRINNNDLPSVSWMHTDDTEMALAIVETIVACQRIDQDCLAKRFAERFQRDPYRGYGKMARMILQQISDGEDWRTASSSAFSGSGSMGNGSAMRVAPLGAYFADNLATVVSEAAASAVVTHSHAEGIAGSIAVAVAAASVCQNRRESLGELRRIFWEDVLQRTPPGATFNGIVKACQLPLTTASKDAAQLLGNGFLVTAPDTVPFALWASMRHLKNFVDAMATTISVDGDCDTNCAIVGGIVALYSEPPTIPEAWLARKEPWSIEQVRATEDRR